MNCWGPPPPPSHMRVSWPAAWLSQGTSTLADSLTTPKSPMARFCLPIEPANSLPEARKGAPTWQEPYGALHWAAIEQRGQPPSTRTLSRLLGDFCSVLHSLE